MKKSATVEEKVAHIAKVLVKEFKSRKGSENSIGITGWFRTIVTSRNGKTLPPDVTFEFGKERIGFGDISESELGNITCRIGDAICSKLKAKKSEILYKDIEEESKWVNGGMWSMGHERKWNVCHKIVLVKPCKEFSAINKKLAKLGCPEIKFQEWYYAEVGGKRSYTYSRYYHYYCENAKMCGKVLEYLKGKKKLAWEYFDDDDLEDRERGERYETEWSGSESRKIRFIDAKGHKTPIYGY